MRKTRENPGRVRRSGGDDDGDGARGGVRLVWARSRCRHQAHERCDGRKGCKVDAGAAALWNGHSREWWSKLNRVAKLRADRAMRRLGSQTKRGLLVYEWELQRRGVWHLHVVVGMETAVEQAWAIEYVHALRELAPRYGSASSTPGRCASPEPAKRVAGYLSKYLAKWREDARSR